jgi:hypothetical protein
MGEPNGRDRNKDRRRRALLLPLLLLLPFTLGGLSVGLLIGGPKAAPQGTPSVPPASPAVPTAAGTQIVQGVLVEATPSPTVAGSGGDVAQVGGSAFTITGGAGNLMLGVSTPIRLTVTNPNGVPVVVTSLTVAIAADSTPPGCTTASNVRLTQSNVSAANPVTIPAKGSVALTRPPGAPQITLLNLPGVNQDVCKNKSFALTYSGSAHS